MVSSRCQLNAPLRYSASLFTFLSIEMVDSSLPPARPALAAELPAEGQLGVVVEVRAADQQHAAPLERFAALGDDGVVEQVVAGSP